ncbi:hypothetical protein BGZ96_002560 [Linnemannia gamsii]|uniref:Eukaryotic mitochondrial regulator protein-domain-containing protein n=1 Tax=Linnemannia gamsii TaxID=64522 RepID=A0ABQ7KAG5_9FUNG|nr:hypothetical protein BGZ96_002560 [Linnemannia gamsii]
MASLSVKALWSATAIRAPLTAASALSSHRLFHSSRAAFNDSKESTDATTPAPAASEAEAEAETAAPVEEKLPFRRRNFNKWLRTEGSRFATPSFSGPNYIGETPFPMNPLFKPTPPISNAAKEEIYKLHRSDSTKHTPRQLGTTYNISIKRVEAILRMKHLEKEMIGEGFVAQENFTKGMEQLMGVKAVRSEAITEPLVDILPQVGSPKFEAVDEDKTFTAVDAAKVLKRRPLAEIKSRMLEEERQRPFKLVDSIKGVPQVEAAPTKAVSRNSAETNPRFKFAFQDTSKNNKGTFIREKDGTLHQVQKA